MLSAGQGISNVYGNQCCIVFVGWRSGWASGVFGESAARGGFRDSSFHFPFCLGWQMGAAMAVPAVEHWGPPSTARALRVVRRFGLTANPAKHSRNSAHLIVSSRTRQWGNLRMSRNHGLTFFSCASARPLRGALQGSRDPPSAGAFGVQKHSPSGARFLTGEKFTIVHEHVDSKAFA